jgi:hypothetical protein
MTSKEEVLKYKIIRQPYRITMARWDFTVTQKRIVTKIISSLQKEISCIDKGVPLGQLEIFSDPGDSIRLTIALNELVRESNNYANVKSDLKELRKFDVQIVLPATKSKTSKQPEEETILTGLIERAILTKYSRDVIIIIHRATAQELVKTSNGLTQFAEEVMYLTNNRYTQKLYEMISHWKDKEVFSVTTNEFRIRFSLENKYPEIKDLIRRVIKPAEIELKEIADVFFVFSTSNTGRKITKFNFAIKHKKTIYEQELGQLKLRNDNIQLLKMHLKFTEDHINSIADILSRNDIMMSLRNKIVELYSYIQEVNRQPKNAIRKIPEYVIQSLKNEYSDNK